MSYPYLRATGEVHNYKLKQQQILYKFEGKDRRNLFYEVQYTQKENLSIKQFRSLVQKNLTTNYDDPTLLRYLYSADFNFQEALTKLKGYDQWMDNSDIQKISDKAHEILKQGMIYTYGRDKKYRPIIIMNLSLIDFNKYQTMDYYCAINALINTVIQDGFYKGIIERYLFVIDIGGKNFTSLPFDGIVKIIQKLGNVYSYRLGAMIVLNVNYFLKISYMAFKPFISEETQQKITMISTSQVSQMKKYINQDQMQVKYGGTQHNLTFHWPPHAPNRKISDFGADLGQGTQQTFYYTIPSDNSKFFHQFQKQEPSITCCSMNQNQCIIY